MYINRYADQLLEKISGLERKIAMYEAEDAIAAMKEAWKSG